MKQQTKNVTLIFVYLLAAYAISALNSYGGNELPDGLKTMIGFVGMLFSILIGFSIGTLWSRFMKIRDLISVEAACLENLYKLFEIADKKVARNVAKKIDEYIIKSLEFELHEYQQELNEEYSSLFECMKNPKVRKAGSVYGRILYTFSKFTETRKEIIARGRDKIGIYQWTALILLSFILGYLWIFIQFPGAFGLIVGTILLFVLAIVLTIIYDLNNLNWGSEQLNLDNYERVYDVIEIPRYYPEEMLNKVKLPSKMKEYRVGYITNKKTYQREIVTKRKN
ncbi:hypothetical protein ACFLQN_04395 [Candidatus Aenigmatarchaeota archaeon]